MMGVRQALAISMGTKYTALVIQLVSTMLLARMLSPEEIGVYSVCAAFVAIAHTLRDFGVSAYLIQEKELTEDRIRTALGITLGIAWFLALCLVCLAYPLALFYDVQGIRTIIFVLAVNFVFIPFGSVHLALLNRDMQFGILWWISTLSVVVHALTSVSLAALGESYMSLAWGALAGTLATVLGVAIVRRKSLVLLPSLRERARVFGFGSRIGISSMASEVGNGAPDMVIGRLIGLDAVGLFSRAMGFVSLFEKGVLDVIRSVALPHFSVLNRQGVAVEDQYVRALEYVIAVAWPVLLFIGLMASPLIELLYGTQWGASVPLAHVLAVAIGIRCMNPLISAVLVAQGAATLIMRTQLVYQAARVGFVVAGAMQGLIWAAYGLVAGELVGAFLFAWALSRSNIGTVHDYTLALGRGSAIAVFSVLPVLALGAAGISQEISQLKLLFYGSPLVIGSWIAALWLFHSPLKIEVSRSVMLAVKKIGH